MQLRWIAIGVVCFSAALLSACGGAPSTALASKADASAMSKSDGRYDTSSKDKDDKDECDESEDHDKSNDKSRSLSTKSKDDDKECKSYDDDGHDKSKDDKSKDHKSSHSLSMSSKYSSKDKDNDKEHDDDDATCKVTVCHVPPGNACKEHKIRVGKSAVRAHIEHGDYLGSCDVPPPPPPVPACFSEGTACTATADCCPGIGLSCSAGLCAVAG